MLQIQENPAPTSFTFPSRTGGENHVVVPVTSKRAGVAGPVGTVYLTCTCPAGKYQFARRPGPRGRGCWAMATVRQMLDIPAY